MILVDTSIWVFYLRNGNSELERILNDGDAVCHPFIMGELACGNIKNREEILSLLSSLPTIEMMDNEEILVFIENKNLAGKGLGLVDIHLLAAALLSGVSLWTLDAKLRHEALVLDAAYK